MQTQRATDSAAQTYFRCERISAINGQFFFATREGTLEGPYFSRDNAEQGAAAYIERQQQSQEIISRSWQQLI